MSEELLTVKQAHDEKPEFSEQKINFAIREGTLKAKRIGTKNYFTRSAWNEYLGIPSNDESIKKDLRIKELEGQLKAYEIKIRAFETLATSLKGLIGDV
jgi:hypothetical protein